MPADSVMKARTPEPRGKGGRNWITKLKPGNRGELPPYIQHVVKALIEKRGMPERRAYAIAMSRPDKWLKSKHADAGTKAASGIAKGELEKDKALNRLRRAGRLAATTASEVIPSVLDVTAIFEAESETLEALEESLGAEVLEAALGRVQWVDGLPLSPREHALDSIAERAAEALTLVEATRTREIGSGKFTNYLKRVTAAPAATNCSNCGAIKLPDKMCPSCEAPTAGKQVSMAEAVASVLGEQLAESSHADLTARVKKLKTGGRIHVGGFQVVKHGTLGSGHHSIHDAKGKQVGSTIASPSEAARTALRHAKKGKLSEADELQERGRYRRVGDPKPAEFHVGDLVHHHPTGPHPVVHRIEAIHAGNATLKPTGKSAHLPSRHAMVNNLSHVIKAHVGKIKEAEIDGVKPTPHAGTLTRVKALKLGETMRMPEGLAITHHATGDGRKVWRADTPSRWSSSGWSLGDEHRTPEDAVKEAFVKSAASRDPASLGGATRLHSYSRVTVGGKEHRLLGVRPHDAKPEVRDISGLGQPGSIKVVGWDELHPPDDIMQQGDGGGVLGSMLDNRLEEAAKARRDTIATIAGKSGPKDTMDFHRKGGKFSKGRAMIHAQMARHVLDNPRAHNSGPVAMVATRSPSGGAVHIVKGAGAAIPHDAVHISIPAMRERLPEHAALAAHSSADERATTDREARHVAKVAATVGMLRGKSVVIHDDPDEGARASDLQGTAARHAGAMRRAAAGA